jgi:hypothetical protein
MAGQVETREAEHGKRMVEMRVRFWTNDLADGKGRIAPKHAWGAGVVRMEPNATHGITGGNPVPFNSMAELPATIEKVLVAHSITIHKSTKMKKYMS